MPKCTVWMTNSQSPCKWSLILLYLHLPPHCSRILLWLLPIQRNLKYRNYSPTHPYSNRLRRLCPTMRPNIILRGHSYHKPILCHPLYRPYTSRVGLRGILRRQSHPDPILHPAFPPPIHYHQPNSHSLNLPPRIRIKQSPRHHIKLRQNPIPPLLLPKRSPGIYNSTSPTYHPSPILPQPPRGPRKLHTSKPPSNPPSY